MSSVDVLGTTMAFREVTPGVGEVQRLLGAPRQRGRRLAARLLAG